MSLEEIKADVKEIKADVMEIKLQVAKNTESLEYHILRTDLSEKRIATIEAWTLGLLTTIVLAVMGKIFFGQ